MSLEDVEKALNKPILEAFNDIYTNIYAVENWSKKYEFYLSYEIAGHSEEVKKKYNSLISDLLRIRHSLEDFTLYTKGYAWREREKKEG